jgi:type VI secretion system VgrG family protein
LIASPLARYHRKMPSSRPPLPGDRLRPVSFELWLPRGPTIQWQVVGFEGVEAISAPFDFEVELVTDDADAPFEEMLGADAELLFDRNGMPYRVYGLISEVHAVVSAEARVARAALAVRVRLVPAFKLLEQDIDTRFFAGQTVVDILRDLLEPALARYRRILDVESCIKGEYNKRDYCMQFRESTFDFCNRIMEEEGIAYVFVADDEEHRETLVLIDNNQDYAEADLLLPSPVPIVVNRPEELDRESIQAFEWRSSRTPNRVVTRGHNMKVPQPPDQGEAERDDPHHPTVREVYHDDDLRQIIDDPVDDPDAQSFTGAALDQRAALAERLLQRHTLEATVGHGRSNAIGFRAGRRFTLGEHPHAALDHHEFLLVRVTHEGTIGDADGAESNRRSYGNSFECIPMQAEFRPAIRTPRPRVHGVQTGVVVGRSQDEVYTDQFGRVRVRFHRDRHSPDDEHASCWMRVAQIWAGAGYGSMVIPRVGMEVVISFVDGNPDRPLVTGCVYDGVNAPPYPLPAELTKSTFKSNSSPGGDGFNELRFEDAHGSEQVFVHAQRRMDMRVRGSLFETCGGSREERVGWERDGERGGDHNTLVRKDVNHHVEEVRYTKIDKQQYETVIEDVIEDFQAKHVVLVGDTSQLSAPKVLVEASDLVSHKAGDIRLSGSSTVSIKGGGKVAIESNNAIELKVGGSFIAITPGEIAIQGVTVRINSGGGVGSASEAEAAEQVEMLEPLDALAADDGRTGRRTGGGGGGRTRNSRTLDPHRAPPMVPPPPPAPGRPTVRPDGTLRQFLTIEWVEDETWCSEPATLRGTTQGYTDGDNESADIINAADGAVQRSLTLTVNSNAYRQPFDVVNLLPRRVGTNFERERALDARAVGQTTPEAIRLRFIPNLTRTQCSIGISRFGLAVNNYEAEIIGNIAYVQGWFRFAIQLDDTVPAGTGGLIGLTFATNPDRERSGGNWRYCERPATGPMRYWNGSAWVNVPATWTQKLGKRNRLLPNAVWRENGVNRTQYGTLAWPGTIPEWGPTQEALAATTLPQWTANINAHWTNKFDLKRQECRSTDPQCCRYKTRCNVSFTKVDVKTDTNIVLVANDGRSNASAWSMVANSPRMPEHEFGHHLGNPDEYEGAALDTSLNDDGAVAGIDDNSIMGRNKTTVKRRHYRTICQHLAAMVNAQISRSYTYQAVPVV